MNAVRLADHDYLSGPAGARVRSASTSRAWAASMRSVSLIANPSRVIDPLLRIAQGDRAPHDIRAHAVPEQVIQRVACARRAQAAAG